MLLRGKVVENKRCHVAVKEKGFSFFAPEHLCLRLAMKSLNACTNLREISRVVFTCSVKFHARFRVFFTGAPAFRPPTRRDPYSMEFPSIILERQDFLWLVSKKVLRCNTKNKNYKFNNVCLRRSTSLRLAMKSLNAYTNLDIEDEYWFVLNKQLEARRRGENSIM